MITQKGNPYIKLFSTLSTVRLVSCILSQLNILCISLVKSHYTENDDSPVIQRSHVTATLHVLELLQHIGFHRSVVFLCQNGQQFIRSKSCVLNFTAVRYSDVRWCLGYTLNRLNCCWPTDVHNQQWLSILRELCAIIDRHA